MSISSAPPASAVSRSRPAIRSRLARRERVAATSAGDLDEPGEQHAAHRVSRGPTYSAAMSTSRCPPRAPGCGGPTGRARSGQVLSHHRRGPGRPHVPAYAGRRRSGAASAPPRAPTTLRIEPSPTAGTVTAEAWGSGAEWVLDRLPRMLGADDDPTGFEPLHKPIADAWRRHRNWRLGATDLVMESLVPAIIEQKVTGQEAFGAFRTMVHRFGERAPGPPSEPEPRGPAVGAALARAAARDPVLGVAAAARRRRPVPARSSTPPGSPRRSSGPAGRRPRSSTAGCARCPASGSGPAPRCAPGRWATPTR